MSRNTGRMMKLNMKARTAIAMLLASSSGLLAQTKPAVPPPPGYTAVRWNEDYSYLKDTSKRSDLFDPIKYVPLGSDDFYISFGGQLRERYELFDNNNFGAGPQDGDGFYLHRILLHADLHATEYFRLFVQGKSSMIDDRDGGPRPTDSDEIDLQQAFFDIKLPLPTGEKDSATLRVGRQDLLYGAQRLISPLDWANVRRTFEGAKLSTVYNKHTIDAFLVRPVLVENEECNTGDDDTDFWGVYDTIALPGLISKGDGTKLEVYGLGLHKRNNTTTPVDSDTYTIGARFYTNPKPFDLDVEGDYQFGQFGSGDIAAWSLAIEGGYTLLDGPATPRVYLGFDIASGDDDPTDSDRETFNQLFPLGHAYFGYIDAVGRQNIIDLHPGLELTLLKDARWAKRVTLRGDYHLFWRESNDDAVYNAGGGVLRADSGSDESYIGSEIDLLLTWQLDRHTQVYVGYSHFFAGDFIEETGADEDIDFFYAAIQYTF